MIKICVVQGSRADVGILAWLIKCLREDGDVGVFVLDLEAPCSLWEAGERVMAWLPRRDYDWMLVLGDRFEVLGAVLAAHLLRIPIAHIAGGDRTEGSYDDAMRDCISRLATLHFVTNELSLARLRSMGYSNVHLVGSPGIDYIRHASWDTGSPMKVPYVVVSYQSETIDGTNEIEHVLATLPDKFAVFLLPNPDRGSEAIRTRILAYCEDHDALAYDVLPHDEFLNLLRYADEFIGNSSAIFYEAPELGVPTRLIGKRQRGRVQPWGDGQASERIVKILKEFEMEQVRCS